jgi:hypothetical protein
MKFKVAATMAFLILTPAASMASDAEDYLDENTKSMSIFARIPFPPEDDELLAVTNFLSGTASSVGGTITSIVTATPGAAFSIVNAGILACRKFGADEELHNILTPFLLVALANYQEN